MKQSSVVIHKFYLEIEGEGGDESELESGSDTLKVITRHKLVDTN